MPGSGTRELLDIIFGPQAIAALTGASAASLLHGLSRRGQETAGRDSIYSKATGDASTNAISPIQAFHNRTVVALLKDIRSFTRASYYVQRASARAVIGHQMFGTGPLTTDQHRSVGSLLGPLPKRFGTPATPTAPAKQGDSGPGVFSRSIAGIIGLAKTITSIGAAFLGLGYAAAKFSELLSESNRDLGKWNGMIAASFAKLDIQRMRLDIQTAGATKGTASGLNEAIANMLIEFQPIREDISRLVNVVGIQVAKGVTAAIATAKILADNVPWLKNLHAKLDEIEKDLAKKGPEGFPGNEALGDIAAGRFVGAAGAGAHPLDRHPGFQGGFWLRPPDIKIGK